MKKVMNSGGVMNSPPRAHACVVCHTEILNESNLGIPRARACAREGARSPEALARWRTANFGGDFDPVRAAVEDAVHAFSKRQPETDRAIWLKVANEIGWERFQDIYFEQLSIVEDAKRRGNPLRAPAAAFQRRLNRYTGHNGPKPEGGAA